MNAAILSIGTELTRGELVDTNSAWLAEQLTDLGFYVLEQTTVDDDTQRITAAIRRLAESAAVVVITGGLGPTSDDLTAAAAAAAAGVELRCHEASLEAIRQRWSARGRQMPASNAKQADLPSSAEPIPNPVGTAPGFSLTLGQARMFFLPGVPGEMKRLFADTVAPHLRPLVVSRSQQVRLRSFGMTESGVADLLEGIGEPGVTIGYRATFPEIEIKILACGDVEREARARAQRVAAEVRRRLGEAVFGDGETRYPVVVGAALYRAGLSLAVAESGTGGLVAATCASSAEGAAALKLAVSDATPGERFAALAVPLEILRAHGPLSAEVTRARALSVLDLSGADLAVAVSAAVEDGSNKSTVWFALAREEHEVLTEQHALIFEPPRLGRLAGYLA
ncbi:MAG: CinA family nicotinamide mononucleotide deamidase-related protein, partial [Acidobacteriota bacterium]